MRKELMHKIEQVELKATPASLEEAVRTLLREGEDAGGGINSDRLVKHLLDDPKLRDEDTVKAYERLRPKFRLVFEEIPSLFYFEGD